MATQVQWRGGSTAEHSTFTGAAREVTVDTQKKTLVVHDGSTAGGEPLLREDQVNLPTSVTNGISVPSANNVALTTNGTERLRITSDGKLGLGASNPGQQMVVRGSQPFLEIRDNRQGTWNQNDVFSGILFGTDDTSASTDPHAFIKTVHTRAGTGHTSSDAGLTFGTSANTTSPATERVRITQDGLVGIGTTSPSRGPLHLHQAGATNTYLKLTNDTTGETAGDGTEIIVNTSGGLLINNRESTEIAFATAATERARIDSSGRLLVGTTTTSAANTALLQASSAGSTTQAILTLARGQSSPADAALLGSLRYADSGHVSAAEINVRRDGGTWTSGTSQPTRIEFSTTADGASSPTERMRISSNGDVNVPGTFYAKYNAVFTWNTTAGIKAVGDGNTNTGGVGIETTTASTATRYHVSISNPNGVVGSISTNGSATAYNTSSDYRLKENVVPLTGAADRIKQLKPSQFNFIADPDTTVDGFIAHEAQAVVPDCATGTKDEVDADGKPVYQGIDQSKLVPLLTAALQEALAEIESLKARLDAANL